MDRLVITAGPAAPAGARRSGRYRRLAILAFLAGFLALLFAPSRWPVVDGGDRRLSDDVGYRAVAKRLAEEGLLVFREVPRPVGGVPLRRLVVAADRARTSRAFSDCRLPLERSRFFLFHRADAAERCAERLRLYEQHSLLRDDLLRLDRWETNGDLVSGLRPDAHVLRAAGISRDIWRGRIEYRPTGEPAGAQAGRSSLLLAEVGSNRPLFRFDAERPKRTVPLGAILSGERVGEGFRLGIVVSRTTASSLFGHQEVSVQRVGRSVLIGIPPTDQGASLYVDGILKAEPSEAFDNIRYFLVRPDQYVTLDDGDGRRATMQLVEIPGSVSELSGRRRLRERTLFDVAQRLEQAGVSANFSSTIDARLHSDLQRRLANRMMIGRLERGPHLSYRGAVLLMDGLTGEIAAAATFPSDIDQLARQDRQDPRRIRWLQTNFNFQPLPIGSAAKVPFAAAIAQAHPDLMATRIAFRPQFSMIDGQVLSLPDGSTKWLRNSMRPPNDPSIDFTRFIAYSNNEYALTLLRRATRRDFTLGRWGSSRSWAANLWNFACVVPYGLRERGSDRGWRRISDHCPAYLWRDERGNALGTRQAPEPRLNLTMGRIDNDYADFYLSILGGGRSTWTNANLGQAYARLLSGRAVSPQLAFVSHPLPPESIGIAQPVWTAIARGMEGVVRYGTARDLWNGGLARIGGVYFFAKTGTPTIAIPAHEDGHVIVLAAVRTAHGRPPAGPADICGLKIMVINLQRDASNAVAFARELVGSGGNSRFLRWMTSPCRSAAATT